MAKIALVKNPKSASLSLSGGKITRRRNPAKSKRRRSTAVAKPIRRKRNPAPITATRRRFKARRNPITGVGQMLSTALFASVGVAGFDYLLNKVLPAPVAPVVRIGAKAGLGIGIGMYGSGLPLIGKYSKEVGLVFVTLALVDGLQTYIVPTVMNSVGGFLSPAQANFPEGEGEEVSDIYYPEENDYDDLY